MHVDRSAVAVQSIYFHYCRSLFFALASQQRAGSKVAIGALFGRVFVAPIEDVGALELDLLAFVDIRNVLRRVADAPRECFAGPRKGSDPEVLGASHMRDRHF